MSRRLLYILFFVTSTLTVSAESYDRVERRNLWNMGRNVTGIMRDTTTISNVELGYRSEEGDFRNFSDASSLWSAGGEAKTISHYDKLSFIGAFDYEHSEGEDMCGSMFIQPNQYPIDILEFTPGDKRLQSYSLMGGITSQISERWSVGVKGEFGAQNYAKFKDLRHYNYRMELSLMPSVAYQVGDFTAGLTYIYARNSETIRAQEVGSAVTGYKAFLDKGLMMGAYEAWSGSGVHLDESGIDGFPVRENFNGFAVQAEWRELYGDFEYLRGRGEVGEKLTYWFDFPSQRYTARVGYRVKSGDKLHLLRFEAQRYTLTNSENVVGSETESGVTTTKIYGSNEIFTMNNISLSPSYEMMFLDGGSVQVGASYLRTFSRATQMYPYVDELTTRCYELYLSGMMPIKEWEFRAGVYLSAGDMSDADYSVSSSVEAGDKPTQLVDYYNIDNEYLTATRLTALLSARYNFQNSLYVQVGGGYTRAFALSYISGASRWSYEFKLGYRF